MQYTGSGQRETPQRADRQGGVFTAAQAIDEGWTARQVRRRIAADRWVRVAGDGLAAPTPGWTAFQLAVAAQLTWPGCVASHLTAASLHGFPVPVVQVAHVNTDKGHRGRRSITPHSSLLTPGEVGHMANGLALTSVRRTAADCLASLHPDDALDLWAWLTTRRILQRADLLDLVRSRRGWRGTAQLKDLVHTTARGAASRAEQRLHALLLDEEIGGWEAGAGVCDGNGLIGVVDLLFREQRIVVEVDGWQAHSSRRAFQTDRRRQNRLINAGYLVLRFTWDDLTRRPTEVLAEIRRALARSRPAPSIPPI